MTMKSVGGMVERSMVVPADVVTLQGEPVSGSSNSDENGCSVWRWTDGGSSEHGLAGIDTETAPPCGGSDAITVGVRRLRVASAREATRALVGEPTPNHSSVETVPYSRPLLPPQPAPPQPVSMSKVSNTATSSTPSVRDCAPCARSFSVNSALSVSLSTLYPTAG